MVIWEIQKRPKVLSFYYNPELEEQEPSRLWHLPDPLPLHVLEDEIPVSQVTRISNVYERTVCPLLCIKLSQPTAMASALDGVAFSGLIGTFTFPRLSSMSGEDTSLNNNGISICYYKLWIRIGSLHNLIVRIANSQQPSALHRIHLHTLKRKFTKDRIPYILIAIQMPTWKEFARLKFMKKNAFSLQMFWQNYLSGPLLTFLIGKMRFKFTFPSKRGQNIYFSSRPP